MCACVNRYVRKCSCEDQKLIVRDSVVSMYAKNGSMEDILGSMPVWEAASGSSVDFCTRQGSVQDRSTQVRVMQSFHGESYADQKWQTVDKACMPMGPSSLESLFNHPSVVLHNLRDRFSAGTAIFDSLVTNLNCGIELWTRFSGMDCPGMALYHIVCTLQKMGIHTGKGIKRMDSCDIHAPCRSTLLAWPSDSMVEHIRGDICTLLTPDALRDLEEIGPMPQKAKKDEVQKHLQKWCAVLARPGSYADSAPCHRHGHVCEAKLNDSNGALKLMVAGHPCTPWSAIGGREKECHSAHLPFLIFLFEALHKKFDIVITECTEYFDSATYAPLVEAYDIRGIVLGPENLGWPAMRRRKWHIMTRRTNATFSGDLETMARVFGRITVAEGDLLCCAPQDVVEAELARLACSQGLNAKEGQLKWMEVLPMSMQMRWLDGYHRLHPDVSGSFFADLTQNPYQIDRSGKLVPTLLRRSCIYNKTFGRLLTPGEHLAALGLPVFRSLEGMSGCTVPFKCILGKFAGEDNDIDGAVKESARSNKCPKTQVLSAGTIKELAGNGMHLGVLTVLLSYILGCVSKLEDTIPFEVVSGESLSQDCKPVSKRARVRRSLAAKSSF